MRLAFIEIAGFRGFKEKARFDLPAGFAVLTGRNGVGKSTVLDAVDFVLTGTINKYVVTDAKGGGLDEHLWWVGEGTAENHYVTIGFVDNDGRLFVVTRSRERGLDPAVEEIEDKLCEENSRVQNWAETLIRTSLIRDETIAALSLDLPEQARFNAVRAAIGGLTGADHTERTADLVRATTAVKAEQELRLGASQAELGRALSSLTEARSVADRQTDIGVAEQIINALVPDLAAVQVDRSGMIRRQIADRKRSMASLDEAVALAERLEAERLYFESDAAKAEIVSVNATHASAKKAKEEADEKRAQAERVEAAERESDTFASHMIALLGHGEAIGLQDGHCPLCNAARSSEEFADAISAARTRLSTRGARVAQASAALETALVAVRQKDAELSIAQRQLETVAARQAKLSDETERVARLFGQAGLAVSPSQPQQARELLLRRRNETAQLEQALFILEGSSAHDRVMTLEARVSQLRAQVEDDTSKLTAAERAVETAKQIDAGVKDVANQILMEQFHTVMPLLKELYQRIRPHMDWREIEMDFGGRIRASLNLTVGDGRNPQFVFSSGQRRAAGIAFLLAIHLSRPWCRFRSVLLDDPVQHIDDFRALNLVEVLSAVRRTGRQVIVAVEDPALADVLCRRLRSTTSEAGRRFELVTSANGSAAIAQQTDIYPLPAEILKTAEA